MESMRISNSDGDILTVQVSGDALGLQLQILAQVDYHADESYAICGQNLTDGATTTTIRTNGLYRFVVEGLGTFKLKVLSINEGDVTAFCRLSKRSRCQN